MDEARAACALDISGRALCRFEGLALPSGAIAGFEHEAAEEFFRAVAGAARLTVHLELQAGTNAHHMIEASSRRSPGPCASPCRSIRRRPACRRPRGR
jgi:imidazoleglycerol-phosphate dehydratase